MREESSSRTVQSHLMGAFDLLRGGQATGGAAPFGAPQGGAYGPAAGAAAFSPASLPSLAAWYTAGPTWCFTDAAGTVPCGDGDLVRFWADRSGNGRTLLQGTSGNRPTLVLTSGKWVVRFDGLNDTFLQGDLSAVFPAAGTLAWRAYMTAAGSVACTRTQHWDRFAADGLGYLSVLKGTRIDLQPGVPLNAWATSVTRSSASGFNRRLNGTQDVTAAADYSAGNNWAVGQGLGTGFLTGDIAAYVSIAAAISDPDAALLETYFATLTP